LWNTARRAAKKHHVTHSRIFGLAADVNNKNPLTAAAAAAGVKCR